MGGLETWFLLPQGTELTTFFGSLAYAYPTVSLRFGQCNAPLSTSFLDWVEAYKGADLPSTDIVGNLGRPFGTGLLKARP